MPWRHLGSRNSAGFVCQGFDIPRYCRGWPLWEQSRGCHHAGETQSQLAPKETHSFFCATVFKKGWKNTVHHLWGKKCKRNNLLVTKVSEEGQGEDAPGAGADSRTAHRENGGGADIQTATQGGSLLLGQMILHGEGGCRPWRVHA